MRKLAIIATDEKPSEDILVEALTRSGYETITIKPDQEIVRIELEKIKRHRKGWEICCFVEKKVADYARSIVQIFGLQAEIHEIISQEETQARIELAKKWGGDRDGEHSLD
jgi:hypothetical protein